MNTGLRQRAVNDQQKQARREAVLVAARKLFVDSGFFNVSISQIAREAGVAKGTVYLYFQTKEEIFMALCSSDMNAWAEELEMRLSSQESTLTTFECAALFTDTLLKQGALCRLASLLHLVLEKNVSFEEVLSFKLSLLEMTKRLSVQIEKVLPFLKEGQGVEVMTSFHSLVIGWGQVTETTPLLDQVLETPELAPFKMDLGDNLMRSFHLILDGLKAQAERA